MRGLAAILVTVSLRAAVPAPAQTSAEPVSRLTLDEALAAGRAANAGLPLARMDNAIAEAGVREARGALLPSVSVEGRLHDGTPNAYATGDGLLVLAVDQSLYDGGMRRAGVRAARASADATSAGYRVSVRDLELEIRLRYAGILATEGALRALRAGVDRLAGYVEAIRIRRAGGEGVGADLLRGTARLADERARVATYERQLDGLRQRLNDLIGRDPDTPLELTPLTDPTPRAGAIPDSPSGESPDVDRALAEQNAAQWQLDQVRAERGPHLSLRADAGTQPVLGTATGAGLNDGEGAGAAITLNLSFPLWNGGALSARRQSAALAVERASHEAARVQRQVRLEYANARSELGHLADEIALRRESVPLARDAYLQAESLYRGGNGSVLEVLDAFGSWVEAHLAAEETLLAYREAEARLIRWGAK